MREEDILDFWEKNSIFQKSIENRSADKPYVFYDGPPFATGLPHYGHILSSVIKDVVPRYWTMKGYRVRRRWGWDCHGLPIENLIEKKLRISGKKEINTFGVEQFNSECRSAVLTYTQEWKKMVDRIGRWVEFDTAYKTMDAPYMESVWWALKTIWDKGLIYEGRKVLLYCPHCETPVSKAEIAMDNSYKNVIEEAVTIKFKLVHTKGTLGYSGDIFLLAWTTTPWTLPGNVALAVGVDIDYSLLELEEGERVIVAKERIQSVIGATPYKTIQEFKGAQLVGMAYEPLFDMPVIYETGKRAYYVASADFVTTEEGTGVVHTAVMYGEDDYNLGLALDLPIVPILNDRGEYTEVVPEFLRGRYIKQAEKDIKRYLTEKRLLFGTANYAHSYPHCWRCDTQLIYNAISAWFINIQKIKARLIELNEKIHWYPGHLKHGRFLNILQTAPDWNISRNRYWATPLPFWKCTNHEVHCTAIVCIGSVKELKEKAINFSDVCVSDVVEKIDLHKHIVDRIKLRCDACGGTMKRIDEVIDCWVESASMPFAEFHYPFENESVFRNRFPGKYIAEYIAQTRAWFYYMHAMAVLLFDNVSFEHCVTTGTILNEKGEKLSKSKMNYTDPWKIIEQYGVDALRFYLMTSVVMEADNLFFNDREVREVYNKVINTLRNVFEYYKMYAVEEISGECHDAQSDLLDRWILSRTHALVREVTASMDAYNTVKATRPIRDFIDELSTWYLRRSRYRFKNIDENERNAARRTLREVLSILSRIIAPFMPFLAEMIYQGIAKNEKGDGGLSVHLERWPSADTSLIDERLEEDMRSARFIVEMAHALRSQAKIKVRQPLQTLGTTITLGPKILKIIADEVNIKSVIVFDKIPSGEQWISKTENTLTVFLDTSLTEELRQEGLLREFIRSVNAFRKESGLTIHDRIRFFYQTESREVREVIHNHEEELRRSVLASSIEEGCAESGYDIVIDSFSIRVSLIKE